MSRKPRTEIADVTLAEARQIWLRAQMLHVAAPFGDGPEATRRAIEHLGYVQIDTINVIERCHHHILFSRIPTYERTHLRQAQTVDKSVFEYWTHALAYVPSRDVRFFLPAMRRFRTPSWYRSVTPSDIQRVVRRIRDDGPITIRDIDDDELIEKDHAWASRKPSKRALQLAFFTGRLTINERVGMVKSYELMDRHFGWDRRPAAARDREVAAYVLDRALTAQGIVSLDSICHLDAARKPAVRRLIDERVRKGALRAVRLAGVEGPEHWARPEALDAERVDCGDVVHILSPFDPLIIQRKRLKLLFGYDHKFEAYVPREKRTLGYFALPVLVGDRVVAALDLKTDRQSGRLLIQKWTWFNRSTDAKRRIEGALGPFERFQLRG